MARTQILKTQIAELQAERAAVVKTGYAHLNNVATSDDSKLVAKSVAAFTKAEEIDRHLEVLGKALTEAERLDREERSDAWRKEHAERVASVHSLVDERVACARDIDAAFAALQTALIAWQKSSDEITALVRGFGSPTHLGQRARTERLRRLLDNSQGGGPAMAFAVSQMLQRMLHETKLTAPLESHLTFNHVHVELRRKCTTARDAANAMAEQIKAHLVDKETANG